MYTHFSNSSREPSNCPARLLVLRSSPLTTRLSPSTTLDTMRDRDISGFSSAWWRGERRQTHSQAASRHYWHRKALRCSISMIKLPKVSRRGLRVGNPTAKSSRSRCIRAARPLIHDTREGRGGQESGWRTYPIARTSHPVRGANVLRVERVIQQAQSNGRGTASGSTRATHQAEVG